VLSGKHDLPTNPHSLTLIYCFVSWWISGVVYPVVYIGHGLMHFWTLLSGGLAAWFVVRT